MLAISGAFQQDFKNVSHSYSRKTAKMWAQINNDRKMSFESSQELGRVL